MISTSLILVEDHNLVRQGFENLLKTEKNLHVAASFDNAESAIGFLLKNSVDLVITDIQLSGMDGLDLASYVKTTYPNLKVILLSMYESVYYVNKAKSLKIEGYVSKRTVSENLINAIYDVLENKEYYDNVIEANRREYQPQYELYKALTKREKEIFLYLAKGMQIKKVATMTDTSVKTVHAHKSNIFEKLEIYDDFSITRLALKLGLIDTLDL